MSEDFDSEDEFEEELVSKSQLKREMHALEKLGERLIGLKTQQWEQLNFSRTMIDALEESRRIKSHNAMRRHIRRLAKLLKNEDAEQVEQLFSRMDDDHLQDTHHFHRLERWRERLLQGDDEVLNELLSLCPDADRQHMRQLIRAGKKELAEERTPAAQRKLFTYLKSL